MIHRYGPFTRRPDGPTGVPADHYQSTRRHVAVDHQGRITALVADGEPDPAPSADDGPLALLATLVALAAVPVHHTATDDGAWDGPAQEKNLPTGDDVKAGQLKPAYAWQDPDGDPTKKADYSFIHHDVAADGKIGAASTKACSSTIGILNGGRGVDAKAQPWFKDRKGIYAHAVAHLKDAGVKDDDLPELEDLAVEGGEGMTPQQALDFLAAQHDAEHFAAAHRGARITHSHPHSAYGTQGGDETHDHEHTHSGDANHSHHAQAAAAADPAPTRPAGKLAVASINDDGSVVTLGGSTLTADQVATLGLEPVVAGPPADRTPVRLRRSPSEPGDGAYADLGVRWDDDADAFVVASAGPDAPKIVTAPGGKWHAYLCVEGCRTDEFPPRELMVGSCQFPDLPVSLRYLVEDEGGHWGAITCGRIDTMTRMEVNGYQVIYAEGVFGSDEVGQRAQLAVEEQTQRFVSIDPRDVEAEIVEVTIDVQTSGGLWSDDDGCCEPAGDYDVWVRYNSLVIGAATIVATPALQQAVIAMADQPLQWAELATGRAPTTPAVTASGAVDGRAPTSWFTDPGFHVGDPRLVRQPDGRYACPLTVDDDGRVYGHVAHWGAKHTARPGGRDVTPPRSPTYAYFTTGAYRTADGDELPVGQLTMGCGHAPTTAGYQAAIAHYDGGYGALQVADVAAGEDDFGIWVAGSLRPGLAPDVVAQFKAQSLSGDWRRIAGKLHMVACLAVPVPGFPIARHALVAAAAETVDLFATRAGLADGGEVHSLVAAGRVQRLSAEERLANLERTFSQAAPLLDDLAADRAAARRAQLRARIADLGGPT